MKGRLGQFSPIGFAITIFLCVGFGALLYGRFIFVQQPKPQDAAVLRETELKRELDTAQVKEAELERRVQQLEAKGASLSGQIVKKHTP
jgi:hypothetical protein